MKINIKNGFIYSIIDFVNSKDGPALGITAAICAVALICTFGYITLAISL